jgi:hypothetical protein
MALGEMTDAMGDGVEANHIGATVLRLTRLRRDFGGGTSTPKAFASELRVNQAGRLEFALGQFAPCSRRR